MSYEPIEIKSSRGNVPYFVDSRNMLRTSAALVVTCAVLLYAAGCGARSALSVDETGDGGAPSEDAAIEDARAIPSCWTEPNCIEADLVFDDGREVYRQVGSVDPTRRVLWLRSPESETIHFQVKLFRRATAGIQAWDPEGGDVFVWTYVSGETCQLLDNIVLREVDTSPGGLTWGEFGGDGPSAGCSDVSVSVTGRFRLTAE